MITYLMLLILVLGGTMSAEVPPGLRPQLRQDRGDVSLWPSPTGRYHRRGQRQAGRVPAGHAGRHGSLHGHFSE